MMNTNGIHRDRSVHSMAILLIVLLISLNVNRKTGHRYEEQRGVECFHLGKTHSRYQLLKIMALSSPIQFFNHVYFLSLPHNDVGGLGKRERNYISHDHVQC